jgi:hypothetical protein
MQAEHYNIHINNNLQKPTTFGRPVSPHLFFILRLQYLVKHNTSLKEYLNPNHSFTRYSYNQNTTNYVYLQSPR